MVVNEFAREPAICVGEWRRGVVRQDRLRGRDTVLRSYRVRNDRLENAVRERLPERGEHTTPVARLRLMLCDQNAGDFEAFVQLAPHFFRGPEKVLKRLQREEFTRDRYKHLIR